MAFFLVVTTLITSGDFTRDPSIFFGVLLLTLPVYYLMGAIPALIGGLIMALVTRSVDSVRLRLAIAAGLGAVLASIVWEIPRLYSGSFVQEAPFLLLLAPVGAFAGYVCVALVERFGRRLPAKVP